MAGFADPEPLATTDSNRLAIRATKPSWNLGSWFSLKKTNKSPLPKVQIIADLDEESDLIDEESLLMEEDLAKPAPVADDCEVGKTKKALNNNSCKLLA